MKNEKLKEIIKHQKGIINNLEDKLLFQKLENYKLENKINRAIEHIQNKTGVSNKNEHFRQECIIALTPILEILKGSDK